MASSTAHCNDIPLRSTAFATTLHTLVGARASISVDEPRARFSLRLRTPAGPAPAFVAPASMLLPMPLNSSTVAGSGTIARLGPDEWLVLCSESTAERTAAEFTQALADASFSLTDIGHRNVGLQVRGERAREVLNGGCPLDLSDAKFPPGSATRTVFGKAEIVLMRPGAGLSFQIECWRSFAPYVHALLHFGAREFSGSDDQ